MTEFADPGAEQRLLVAAHETFAAVAQEELARPHEPLRDTPTWVAFETVRTLTLGLGVIQEAQRPAYQRTLSSCVESLLAHLDDESAMAETMAARPASARSKGPVEANALKAEFLTGFDVEDLEPDIATRVYAARWETAEGIADPLLRAQRARSVVALSSMVRDPGLRSRALPLLQGAMETIAAVSSAFEADPAAASQEMSEQYTLVADLAAGIVSEALRVYGSDVAQTLYDRRPVGTSLLGILSSFAAKIDRGLLYYGVQDAFSEGMDIDKLIDFGRRNGCQWSGWVTSPFDGPTGNIGEELRPGDVTYSMDDFTQRVSVLVTRQHGDRAARRWLGSLPDSQAKLQSFGAVLEVSHDPRLRDQLASGMVSLAHELVRREASAELDAIDYLRATRILREHGFAEQAARLLSSAQGIIEGQRTAQWTDQAGMAAHLYAATETQTYAEAARNLVAGAVVRRQQLLEDPGPGRRNSEALADDLLERLMFTTEELLDCGISDFGPDTDEVYAHMVFDEIYGETVVREGVRQDRGDVLAHFRDVLTQAIAAGYDMSRDPARVSRSILKGLEAGLMAGGDTRRALEFATEVLPYLYPYSKAAVVWFVDRAVRTDLLER